MSSSPRPLHHLGDNIIKRLEASWKSVKQAMSSAMVMDECLSNLWSFQVAKETEHCVRVKRIGIRQNQRRGPDMATLAKTATQFACDIVQPQ